MGCGFYKRDAQPMELSAAAVEGIHLQVARYWWVYRWRLLVVCCSRCLVACEKAEAQKAEDLA